MARQAGWLWGLVPLAVLWGSANLLQSDAVRRDVEARAATAAALAGSAPGARPFSVRVDGRDVSLDGEALSADGAAKALAQIGSEFGVRRVLGGLTQVVAQKPYSWAATRAGGTITLNGFVPDEATAAANVAAARALGLDGGVDNRQVVAFGAKEGFSDLTRTMIADLGQLSAGKVGLDDARFCVEGTAISPEAYLALRASASRQVPAGFSRVDCPLSPPTVTAWSWAAEKLAGGVVTVTGFYASDAARQEVAGLLAKAFPGAGAVVDRSLPAQGEPAGFAARIARAVGDLAKLRSGKVELDATGYRVAGEGPADYSACIALRDEVVQAGAAPAAAGLVCPEPPPPPAPPAAASAVPDLPPTPPLDLALAPPPPPPATPKRALQWRAEKSGSGIALSGLVPDAAARAALTDAIRRDFGNAALSDNLTLEPNLLAPLEFGPATRFALDVLARLDGGSVAIAGTALSMNGTVAESDRWLALNEAIKVRPLPGGLTEASGRVLLRPYGFSASRDETGLSLSGPLPDQGARDAILGMLANTPQQGKVRDETVIIPGAPSGFGVAARAAVMDVMRLDGGSAKVTDQQVVVQGKTCRDLVRSEIQTSVGSELPPGFTGSAAVDISQSGCAVDPPSTCQSDLDALTQRYYVMFGQGTAVVNLDPVTERAVGEAFAILKQCPTARVVVEGHANVDGERKGYNNRELSLRRAGRVREELIRRGLDPEQLTARGYGVERPLEPHEAPGAKVRNRRVQFTVAR